MERLPAISTFGRSNLKMRVIETEEAPPVHLRPDDEDPDDGDSDGD